MISLIGIPSSASFFSSISMRICSSSPPITLIAATPEVDSSSFFSSFSAE